MDSLVTVPQVGILQRDTKIACLLCNKNYILANMRGHVGKHILRHICGETKGEPLFEVLFFASCILQRLNVYTARIGTMWILWQRGLPHQT